MAKRDPQCYFDIETEKLICQDYIDGLGGATFLRKKYNAPSDSTIYHILKAYNISRRTLSEARRISAGYSINEDSFTDITDPETCYWLGVMYTDGYISKVNKYTNYFGIAVQANDKEWIEKFKKYLEYSGEIKEYVESTGYTPGAKYIRLLIGNNKIVEQLEKLGVVEHKTKIIDSIPNVQCIDDFIRGVVDGDGSLRKEYPNVRISGNYNFLKDIAEYLSYPCTISEDKSIWCLSYNVESSKKIEKRLYENAGVYLERKYQIAKRSF